MVFFYIIVCIHFNTVFAFVVVDSVIFDFVIEMFQDCALYTLIHVFCILFITIGDSVTIAFEIINIVNHYNPNLFHISQDIL